MEVIVTGIEDIEETVIAYFKAMSQQRQMERLGCQMIYF